MMPTAATSCICSTYDRTLLLPDPLHVGRWVFGVHEGDDAGRVGRRDVENPRLRIESRSAPVTTPSGSRRRKGSQLAFGRAIHFRWRIEWTVVVLADDAQRFGFQGRRVVEQIVFRHALLIEGRRLRRNRLCRRIPLPGHLASRHWPFLNGPYGLPRDAIEHVDVGL